MVQENPSRERNRVLNERNWNIGSRAVVRFEQSPRNLGHVAKPFSSGQHGFAAKVFRK
jgi:hypothetical protein